MKKFVCLIGVALVTAPLTAGMAEAKTKPVLTYFLPKTVIDHVTVTQRLIACEPNDGIVAVQTSWDIAVNPVPDYAHPIRLDASAGFLAKRSVALTLLPEGTLTGINTTSEGQGGKVAAAGLGLLGALAPIVSRVPPSPGAADRNFSISTTAFGLPGLPPPSSVAPPPSGEQCLPTVVNALAQVAKLRAAADALGDPAKFNVVQQAQLDAIDHAIAVAEKPLFLKAAIPAQSGDDMARDLDGRTPCLDRAKDKCVGYTTIIAPLPLGQWFVNPAKTAAKVPGGQFGFLVRWKPHDGAVGAFAAGDGTVVTGKPARNFVYRQPVSAEIIAAPCAEAVSPAQGVANCVMDDSPIGTQATSTIKFAVPQLSGYFGLPVGAGGMFGSSEVHAAFDPWGSPTTLAFGGGSAATAAGDILTASGDTATKLHNAELDAMQHAALVNAARKALANP